MHRRFMLAAALAAAALPALAHHGWSSFNQDQPLYIEGRIKSVQWRNPHAEAVVEVAPTLKLPGDLAQRKMPAQSQNVDGAAIVGKTQLPSAARRRASARAAARPRRVPTRSTSSCWRRSRPSRHRGGRPLHGRFPSGPWPAARA